MEKSDETITTNNNIENYQEMAKELRTSIHFLQS